MIMYDSTKNNSDKSSISTSNYTTNNKIITSNSTKRRNSIDHNKTYFSMTYSKSRWDILLQRRKKIK